MKLSKILLTIGIVFFAIVSCGKDDLELANPNELSEDTYFKRPEQLQSAVDAIYANLQTEALFSRVWYYMYDNMSHEVETNPQHEANKRVYFDFNYDADDGYIFEYWDNCFRGINKANFVIQNEDKFENVTTELIRQSIGEAKFMRAFYYSMLVQRFGGVPLYIEPTGEGQPRATEEAVYAQIIEDLQDAASKLSSKANTDGGRPSAGSAQALLGKMYLHTEQWQAAADAFKSMSGYALTSNYEDNFLEETEFNIESVYEINFTLAFGATTDWNGVGTGTGIHEFSFRGQDMGWNDWFNSYPSQDLVDEYESNDPRFGANFYVNGDLFNNGNQTVELPLERTVAWKKYQLYYKQSNENQASGINCRVIRYADVLLMLAEAENELGNSSAAVDLLNQVRDRVGMPRYGTAEMDALYPVANKEDIFEAIVHERKVELAGEQVRFQDLIRWDMADEELAQFGFKKGIHERFPIPFREINTNPNISASEQNPGF
ncbi:MAG: RagB/SusD family nutrient uptake outer membrane protein [Chitinophagales bacterium]